MPEAGVGGTEGVAARVWLGGQEFQEHQVQHPSQWCLRVYPPRTGTGWEQEESETALEKESRLKYHPAFSACTASGRWMLLNFLIMISEGEDKGEGRGSEGMYWPLFMNISVGSIINPNEDLLYPRLPHSNDDDSGKRDRAQQDSDHRPRRCPWAYLKPININQHHLSIPKTPRQATAAKEKRGKFIERFWAIRRFWLEQWIIHSGAVMVMMLIIN